MTDKTHKLDKAGLAIKKYIDHDTVAKDYKLHCDSPMDVEQNIVANLAIQAYDTELEAQITALNLSVEYYGELVEYYEETEPRYKKALEYIIKLSEKAKTCDPHHCYHYLTMAGCEAKHGLNLPEKPTERPKP